MEDVGVQDILDRILTDHDHVSTSNSARRDQALRNLRRIYTKVWNHRNWAFRYKTATPTATNGIFTLSDFTSFGPSGGLIIPGQTMPLRWMPLNVYRRMLLGVPRTGTPFAFTELGVSSGARQIGLYPAYTGALTVWYQFDAPTLTDANTGGLEFFPLQWRESVLYEGTVGLQMKDKANIQSQTEQKKIFEDNLATMVREERGGRSDVHNLVPYGALRGIR